MYSHIYKYKNCDSNELSLESQFNYNWFNNSCNLLDTSSIGQLIASPVLRTRISTSLLSNVFLLTVIRNG